MCDWTIVHTGEGNQVTSLAIDGSTMYAGWCGGGCNPGVFTSGIDTNYAGTWHTIVSPAGNGGDPLSQRLPTALTLDPSDPAHVYAVYGAYSRRWIPGGGVGHVFESTDGGATWTDISGNAGRARGRPVIVNGQLVLSMDVGVFVADQSAPTVWSSLGSGLPAAAPTDLTVSPDGSYVVAVTHGRGLWSVDSP